MALNDFQVRWEIADPFNFCQRPRYDFVLQDPIPTGWHVEFITLDKIFDIRKFYCCLQYHSTVSEPKVTAERVEIVVLLNHVQVSENRILEYPFSPETRYLLNCFIEIDNYDDRNTNIISILIRIDLKRAGLEAARALRGNVHEPLLFGGELTDMLCLTHAIGRCLTMQIFPTMRLFSREKKEHFVHHYILQVRWTNLFKVHGLDENSDFVIVDISDVVLKIILKYMYTSSMIGYYKIFEELLNVTELFRVIFQYEIFHLYGAFCEVGIQQSLCTVNNSDRRRIPIVLHFVRNIRLEQHSVTFPIYVHPCSSRNRTHGHVSVHTFLFTVHVRQENLAGPWLSYSVLSQAGTPFNLHVSLEVARSEGKSKYIHSGNYDIPENARIVSGPILFLGCPGTFSGHSLYPQDNEIREKLLFGLTFQYAERVISIWHQSIPNEIANKPFDVFSQHMMVILRKEFKTDLQVQVNSPRNGCAVAEYPFHKAIFASRIPDWREIVEPNLTEVANLPDSVRVRFLTRESFYLVSLYMYTGKTFLIPETLRTEILSFAHDANFDEFSLYITHWNNPRLLMNATEFLNL